MEQNSGKYERLVSEDESGLLPSFFRIPPYVMSERLDVGRFGTTVGTPHDRHRSHSCLNSLFVSFVRNSGIVADESMHADDVDLVEDDAVEQIIDLVPNSLWTI
jgi:hypothetical protein